MSATASSRNNVNLADKLNHGCKLLEEALGLFQEAHALALQQGNTVVAEAIEKARRPLVDVARDINENAGQPVSTIDPQLIDDVDKLGTEGKFRAMQLLRELKERVDTHEQTLNGPDGKSGIVADVRRMTADLYKDGKLRIVTPDEVVAAAKAAVSDEQGNPLFVTQPELHELEQRVSDLEQNGIGDSFRWGLFTVVVLGGAVLGAVLGWIFSAWGLGLMIGGAIGAIIGMFIAGRKAKQQDEDAHSDPAPATRPAAPAQPAQQA